MDEARGRHDAGLPDLPSVRDRPLARSAGSGRASGSPRWPVGRPPMPASSSSCSGASRQAARSASATATRPSPPASWPGSSGARWPDERTCGRKPNLFIVGAPKSGTTALVVLPGHPPRHLRTRRRAGTTGRGRHRNGDGAAGPRAAGVPRATAASPRARSTTTSAVTSAPTTAPGGPWRRTWPPSPGPRTSAT